jgi:phage host-nuclease inhibitor protein Gam
MFRALQRVLAVFSFLRREDALARQRADAAIGFAKELETHINSSVAALEKKAKRDIAALKAEVAELRAKIDKAKPSRK